MKTDELIQMLARQAGPAPQRVVQRRLAPAMAGGLLLGLVLALAWRGMIDPALFMLPGPMLKLAYGAALAAAAAWWVARLGRPGAASDLPARAAMVVVAAVAVLGALALAATPEADRARALMGHSWAGCPLNVLSLSLPALGTALWALRGLAPTQLRRSGFAAGLLAGALGATAYAFSCTELSPGFVAVWYTAGIALTAALGAALGPRVLRW